jgi:hypothetical protein
MQKFGEKPYDFAQKPIKGIQSIGIERKEKTFSLTEDLV